ncbi:MAG: glycosyltransferase family 4 protein [Candidatus Nitrosocosmicus sp.]
MPEVNRNFSVLMVCTEYPPMQGGIGRYTFNLVKSLQKYDVKVNVLSSFEGNGDYKGISPFEENNSEIINDIVQKINPDIVHIQHEQGLYNFKLHPLIPSKSKTSIDKFYSICKVPIVSTFHTSYDFKTWMQSILINGKDPLHLRYLYKYWMHLINFSSFKRTTSYAISKSYAGIVLSNYMTNLVPGTQVVYHGSEPYLDIEIGKKEARRLLSLPVEDNEKILLVQGFLTATKGWDVIRKMNIPNGWKIVLNYSKDHYNKQIIDLNLNDKKNLINLGKDYLSEEELSLLFFASDVVFLPYKAIAGSGTMFDGLGHGKPFLASDNGFFREYAKMGLGIVAKRNASSFEEGLQKVDKNYGELKANVNEFKGKLKWDVIAKQHFDIYEHILSIPKEKDSVKTVDIHSKPTTKISKV